MKIQTTKTKKRMIFINIFLFLLCTTSLILSYLELTFIDNSNLLICILSFIALIYISYLGCPYFKYDSNGETLIIENKKGFPLAFLVKNKLSDFPKTKLISFKVENQPLLKKELSLFIDSKRNKSGKTKLNFDISYLNENQIKGINKSLNKVINENKTII